MTESMSTELRARIEEDVLAESESLGIAFKDFESEIEQFNGESDMQNGKYLGRQFIQGRAANRAPLPSMAEIQRQLGKELADAARDANRDRYDLPDAPIKPFF
jgi:hypothetical protein